MPRSPYFANRRVRIVRSGTEVAPTFQDELTDSSPPENLTRFAAILGTSSGKSGLDMYAAVLPVTMLLILLPINLHVVRSNVSRHKQSKYCREHLFIVLLLLYNVF